MLCSRIERARGDTEALIAAADTEWGQLAELDKADEQAIRTRFDAACAAARDGKTPLNADDETAKAQEIFCIRMEIVAGLESPGDSSQTRMAYQVERLARAMSGERPASEDGGAAEAKTVAHDWYLSGPCSEALEQRFETARAAVQL